MSVVFWNDSMDACSPNNWSCDGVCRSIYDFTNNINYCKLRGDTLLVSHEIDGSNYKNIGILYRYYTPTTRQCSIFVTINGNSYSYIHNLNDDITTFTNEDTGIIAGLDGQRTIHIVFETPNNQGDCQIDNISVYGIDTTQNIITDYPTEIPTNMPVLIPNIIEPSYSPTNTPSNGPTDSPNYSPTNTPNHSPTNTPYYSATNTTNGPSIIPTNTPTYLTNTITMYPSVIPSIIDTIYSPINTTIHSPIIEPTVSIFIIGIPPLLLTLIIIGFVIFICGSILTAIHVYIKCFRKHRNTESLAASIDDNNKTRPSESVPNINDSYPVKLQHVNTSINKHKMPSQPKINNTTHNGEQNNKNATDLDIENSEINSMNEGITALDIDLPKMTTDGNDQNDV